VRPLILAALLACGRDDAPLEQLPAPPLRESTPILPRPPPPPPPPLPGPIPPPEVVRAFLAGNAHHERPCRVSIGFDRRTIELDPNRAEQLFERLGRADTWIDGINACVSRFLRVRISCRAGEPPLEFETTCGNVWIGGIETAGWSRAMDAWFRTLL
jgi:hypothetical protein